MTDSVSTSTRRPGVLGAHSLDHFVFTVPDLDALRSALATEDAADAMKFDGVRPETIVMLVES